MYAIVYLNTAISVPPSHNISARQQHRYRLRSRRLIPKKMPFLPRVLSVLLCHCAYFRQRIRLPDYKQVFVFNPFMRGES